MRLKERGFKFTYQKGRKAPYNWTHPACVTSDMQDLTDMDDEEFEVFVLNNEKG